MTATAALAMREGWHASLQIAFAPRGTRTALVHRQQRGPLAVQRPFYPEGALCHLYLLHPPGGVVGGDRLEISAETAAGASALVTTPGATKFYLSAGPTAHQHQRLHVAGGAALEWLPQENIFFPGALGRLETRITLGAGARFIGWEIHCLGRPVIEESFDAGDLDLRYRLEREGRCLLMERLSLTAMTRRGASGLRGAPVTATLVATPAGARELGRSRAIIGGTDEAAATLLDDVLVVRYLGHSTEQCRRLFIAVWAAVREGVVGCAPCPPRIWST